MFDDLKPGDKVFLVGRRGSRSMRVVEKVTQTQITLVGGAKYSRNGREWGAAGSYSSTEIEPYNEEQWQDILAAKAEDERQMHLARIRAACAAWVGTEMTADEVMRLYDALRNSGMQEVK